MRARRRPEPNGNLFGRRAPSSSDTLAVVSLGSCLRLHYQATVKKVRLKTLEPAKGAQTSSSTRTKVLTFPYGGAGKTLTHSRTPSTSSRSKEQGHMANALLSLPPATCIKGEGLKLFLSKNSGSGAVLMDTEEIHL